MQTYQIVLLIVAIIMVGVVVALYFFGKKAQAKQAEQEAQMAAAAQQTSLFVIDKKKMRLKDAGLPDIVLQQAPWYAKNSKLPIVKAKVGKQVMSLIADANVFEDIPVNREVKVTISGLYITKVKQLHGKAEITPKKKKKGLREWALRKQKELSNNK